MQHRGGVTIGDGAVIGACSLVTRSIPPRALAYGMPAEVVRILDEDEKVDRPDDDEDDEEEEESVETLEEALNLRSREATPVPTHGSGGSGGSGGGEMAAAAAKPSSSARIYERPRRDRSRQHLGVRDSHGMTRAEILALVALAVSFMGCFFFVALLVVAKWESGTSVPRTRDL